MMTDTKKKKSNMRREVGLGGCSVIFMSPLIVFALLSSVMGILSGLSSISFGFQSVGLTMVAVFGVITMVLLVTAILYIRRLRELYRRGRYLGAEQARVAEMIHTQSAEHHLMDKPKQTDIVEKEKSPLHQTAQG